MALTGKLALIAVQLVGLVISVFLVAATYLNPVQVQERLQDFAIAKVEHAADAALSNVTGNISNKDSTGRLANLSRQLGIEAEALDLKRQKIVPALLAEAYSDRCKENCEFWATASEITDSVMLSRIAQLRVGQVTLQEFVLKRYETSVRGLLLDLRHFGLVNVLTLSLMMGLVIFRNYLNWRFMAFSIAVTAYTAWATYGYVYKQNWALSILLQDWAAPGYQAGMIFAALLFFDWLFLRGRITEMVGNLISSILPG